MLGFIGNSSSPSRKPLVHRSMLRETSGMNPVKFFEITLVGNARKPQLTPATRGRLQPNGVSFFGISIETEDYLESPNTDSNITAQSAQDNKPSLDELFETTVDRFNQRAENPDQFSVEKNPNTSISKQESIINKATNFYRLDEIDDELLDTSEPSIVETQDCVMIVEDDIVIAGFLEHMLERRGFEVKLARDGRKASEMINAIEPPKLIILDIMLPFVDGFELINRIRSKSGWKTVPIMMLTSKTEERDVMRALESGANDYLFKPFQSRELIARVDRYMS